MVAGLWPTRGRLIRVARRIASRRGCAIGLTIGLARIRTLTIGCLLLPVVLLTIGLLLVVAWLLTLRLLTVWLPLVSLFPLVIVSRFLGFVDWMVDVALVRSCLCIAGLIWLRLVRVGCGP